MKLGAPHHTEWGRADVANHAQIAGLGHVGKGLEWILCRADREHMRGESNSIDSTDWRECS